MIKYRSGEIPQVGDRVRRVDSECYYYVSRSRRCIPVGHVANVTEVSHGMISVDGEHAAAGTGFDVTYFELVQEAKKSTLIASFEQVFIDNYAQAYHDRANEIGEIIMTESEAYALLTKLGFQLKIDVDIKFTVVESV
jgi:hypothetical protein